MEKLIELLNKYEEEELYEYDNGIINTGYDMQEVGKDLVELEIISKEFGFIKWLVENDKIDMVKARYHGDKIYYKEYGVGDFCCADYEFVIMLLSISDEPIQDLISLLK